MATGKPELRIVPDIGRSGRALVIVGAAALADYAVWLAWDTKKYLGSDGYLHGPYQPWQVVGFALILGMIGAAAGWRRRPWEAAIAASATLGVCFVVQGAMDPSSDGLFLIGAFLIGIGSFVGVGLVALIADGFAGHHNGETSRWSRRPWVWVLFLLLLFVIFLF
jgi:hypothetical protein